MFKQKREKLTATTTPEKTRPEKSLVQLTEAQLEACSGGAGHDDGCPPWNCGGNHNETIVSAVQLNFEGGTDVAHKNLNYLPHQTKLPQKSPRLS